MGGPSLTLSYTAIRKSQRKGIPSLMANVLLTYLENERWHLEKSGKMDDTHKTAMAAWPGSFPLTIETLSEDLGVEKNKQSRLLAELSRCGLLEVRRIGMPCKRYVRLKESKN